jgi:hypothetical protein
MNTQQATRRYTWIATASDAAGTHATVLSHHTTSREAFEAQRHLPHGGYEGPVPVDMYPVGKRFPITPGLEHKAA